MKREILIPIFLSLSSTFVFTPQIGVFRVFRGLDSPLPATMRTNCCHGFLAFNLKFFNFLHFFVGISIVIYSLYALNQWQHLPPVAPPPSIAPPPHAFESMAAIGADRIDPLFLAAELMVSGSDEVRGLGFADLPAPWFIYFMMGIGAVNCCVSGIGYVAAEAINGCCLSFYTLLTVVLLLLEGAMVAFIGLNHSWEKVLPFDPTGEVEGLKDFFEVNADLCKWVGIALLSVQVFCLLLAYVLKSMITTQRTKSDVEDYYIDTRDGNRVPLLTTQPIQASGSFKSESKATLPDIWNLRVREKYGLNNGSSKSPAN